MQDEISWNDNTYYERDLITSKNKLNKMKILPACKTRHITWTRI